jgi:hypothetical protein
MESAADAETPSQDTLQRAPARALSLLLGVGRAPHIWAHLSTRGYTAAEHATGWKLLRATDPSAAVDPAAPARQNDAAVQDAMAQLDAWDNENLPIASVALRRREPAVHAYLFAHGLKHADGAASVRVVGIFLDRVDGVRAVAEGRSKEDVSFDRSQARKALALLHSRGLTEAALGDVRAWLKTVQRGAEPTETETVAAPAGHHGGAAGAVRVGGRVVPGGAQGRQTPRRPHPARSRGEEGPQDEGHRDAKACLNATPRLPAASRSESRCRPRR